jgi:hypothetical protein
MIDFDADMGVLGGFLATATGISGTKACSASSKLKFCITSLQSSLANTAAGASRIARPSIRSRSFSVSCSTENKARVSAWPDAFFAK